MSITIQVLRDDESQEHEYLHCSHSAVHDGEWGECKGASPEVHDHLRVVSSANFRSLTEGSLEVQSLVYREKSSGERTQP